MKTFCSQDTWSRAGFESGIRPIGGSKERAWVCVCARPQDARFPFALTGHLVMVGQEYCKTCQLLFRRSMHPCNRVTLFCGEREKKKKN